MKRFGLIIVGDEILSGKRQDKHLSKVIALLAARGLSLSWAHYVGDDRGALTQMLRTTLAGDDVVFSTGGIGATPDDHTRQACAAALGTELVLHSDAQRLIAERFLEQVAAGTTPNDDAQFRQRLRMGEFPTGAQIIPNPYNRIPGFNVGQHYFVPGFPVMAWPMLEWVLDTYYADWFHRVPQAERSMLVFDCPESLLTPLMEQIQEQYPAMRVFSLPSVGEPSDGGHATRRHIELGVKGPADQLDSAWSLLLAGVRELSRDFQELAGP